MRLSILQPSYLPWLGFFDQMIRADTFVFLDDVQFTRRDWRNRNKIRTREGVGLAHRSGSAKEPVQTIAERNPDR